jgi:putative ABC transport system permease protein
MTPAQALIRALGLLAPRRMRDRWTEEWLGEIEHANAGFGFALGALPDVVNLYLLPRAVAVERHSWINGLRHDVRHAARNLRAAPGFTATVVASLTVGLVVVTAAYAFISTALFPALPGVPHQSRLIEIFMERSTLDERAALHAAVDRVDAVASMMPRRFAIGARGQVLSVRGAIVSANYFDVLGTRVQAGRGFLESEERPAAGAVAVLSAGLSRRLFGGDSPVGRFMTVAGQPVQVVGVAEDGFRGTYLSFGTDTDLYVSWGMADRVAVDRMDAPRPPAAPGEFELTHLVRLHDQASKSRAIEQATLVAPRLVSARIGPSGRPSTRARALGRDDGADVLPEVAAILVVPFLVLLIGCINAATLVLVRGTVRRRDVAVRLALGASRWRVVRYFLVESLLLALITAAVTLPVLSWTLAGLGRLVPATFTVDGRVAAFAVLVSCASVLLFGLAPAVRLSAASDASALASSRTSATPRRARTRQVLVAVQVALSIVLLATGGQLLTAVREQANATGVADPSRLLLVSFDLSQINAPQARAEAFYANLLERVERLPGVQRAGLAGTGAVWTLGWGRGQNNSIVAWPPAELPTRGLVPLGGYAGGHLIEAVGLELVAGRLFTPADRGGPPRVAIVNQTAAVRYFGGVALGRTMRVAPRDGSYETAREVEIVGVITPALDPQYARDPRDPTVAAVYLPERLRHEPALTLYVRTRAGARPVLPAIQRAAASIDAGVPILDSATLAQQRVDRQGEERFAAYGLTALGLIGLALAAGGVYGMVSFLVASGRREIGVRMALGARPQGIVRLMLARGIGMAMAGAGVGAAIAAGVSLLFRAQMYGVPPIDVLALVGAAGLLVAVVLLATVIPARAAARVDPLVVLREE